MYEWMNTHWVPWEGTPAACSSSSRQLGLTHASLTHTVQHKCTVTLCTTWKEENWRQCCLHLKWGVFKLKSRALQDLQIKKWTANVYSVDVPIQWYQVDTDACFLSFFQEEWRKLHQPWSRVVDRGRRTCPTGQVVSQESKGSRPAFQQQTSSRELGSGWSPEKQQLEEGQHAEVCLTLSSTAGSNYIYLTCFTLRSNQQQGQEANFKLVVEYISCHLCFKFVIIHLF